jgi:predicted ABC-type transport system involved in lysophospholipase L1 biosynthesis ATPase subunit
MRIVTHDANVAARTQRVIQMVDGVIVENAHDFLKLSL